MANVWRRRDASYDGVFFFGVKTTGVFCRPSCPSRPKREHLEFFPSGGEAVEAGYRPCKRCQPELANGQPPEWITKLMARAAESPDTKISARDLLSLGVQPERARRWFQKHHGMTFAAWCRGLRLSSAFTQIRSGRPMDDVVLCHGFESHSGFRAAFTRTFGKTPGKVRDDDYLRVALLDTPLGLMLAAASIRPCASSNSPTVAAWNEVMQRCADVSPWLSCREKTPRYDDCATSCRNTSAARVANSPSHSCCGEQISSSASGASCSASRSAEPRVTMPSQGRSALLLPCGPSPAPTP